MFSRLLDNLRQRGVITVMAPYTVAAWLIMQVVALLQPALALPQWVVSLFTVLLIAGFPVAFYIAWFFEFTPNGLKRTTLDPEPSDEPLDVRHWAGLGVTTIAALGLGFVGFGEVRTNLAKEAEGIEELALEQSIAVLPFQDQSADQDQRYLAEGIAQEMTSLLGRMPGLTVAAASSTFRLAARDMDPVEIGRRLDVATLLGGSVRSQGDQLKVRVELINVEDGKVLWTQNFSRKLVDIFSVEEEITRSIVNLLQDRYIEKGGVTLQSKTASTDAYVLYLKGEEEFRKRTTQSIKAARKLFEEAVGLDPEYASAHVGVAKTVLLLAKGEQNFGTLDLNVAATLAERSVEKALVRAPELPDAFASLGRVHDLRGQPDEALSAYDKAIGLNPSFAQAYQWKYFTLERQQRYAEAAEAVEMAVELDPASPGLLFNAGHIKARMGRYEEATTAFHALLDLYPDTPLGSRGLADVACRQGRLAECLEHWQRVNSLSPDHAAMNIDYFGLLFMLEMEEVIPLATDPFFEANILLLQKDYEALHEKMAFDHSANPEDPWIAFEAGWYQMLVGDVEKGADLLIAGDPFYQEGERFLPYSCMPGVELAFAYQVNGNMQKASEYTGKCREMLAREQAGIFPSSDMDFLDARLWALEGNPEKAAEALQRAFENGWRDWWVDLDPILKSVAETEKGQAAIAAIKEALAEEREKAKLLFVEE